MELITGGEGKLQVEGCRLQVLREARATGIVFVEICALEFIRHSDFGIRHFSIHSPVFKYAFNLIFNVSRPRKISDFVADTEHPSTFEISS